MNSIPSAKYIHHIVKGKLAKANPIDEKINMEFDTCHPSNLYLVSGRNEPCLSQKPPSLKIDGVFIWLAILSAIALNIAIIPTKVIAKIIEFKFIFVK